MLQIKDIRKQYKTGDLVQTALDGVSLTLRDSEFVAILGPSGSGKTTMLNVIGGLDRYDSGDLIINGISTRKYSDRDWDSYRNHTIGFVFQSYNLIPHQTVLANVELALTISGISPGERRKRAAKALEDVGLGNQLHKRPNQMSGGQMQRVAIARALVNNPDILLADEPTGALDSDTSVQIMDLLQEVAKDRLVVMVTHNPELAEEYANRIVRVKDGRIIGDTNPYEVEDNTGEAKHKNMGRSSMSLFTALSLSFNNLRTKKARTLLTAFAGSIGIIGIALIMSLSTGFQKYIDQIQEDTLSNYPLSIMKETSDMSSMLSAYGASSMKAAESEEGIVVEQPMVTQMFAQVGSNDLASFKAYLETHYDEIDHTINDIKYNYSVTPLIFAEDTSERILQVNPGTLFGDMMGGSPMASYMSMDVFQEMIGNTDMLTSQYDVLEGRWPEHYDELIVVLSDPSQITDYMAYTLGLKDPKALTDLMAAVMRGETVDAEAFNESEEWSYEELMALRLRLVPASALYRYNEEYSVWENMSGNTEYMRGVIEKGVELKIVGIVCPKEGVSTSALSPGVAYTSDLTEYVVNQAMASEIVAAQLASPDINVFTGKVFGEESEDNALDFENMISVDENALSNAFGMNVDMNAIMSMLGNYMGDLGSIVQQSTAPAQKDFTEALTLLATDMLHSWTSEGPARIYFVDVESMVQTYLAGDQAAAILAPLVTKYGLPQENYIAACRSLLTALVTGYVSANLNMDGLMPEPTEPEEIPEPTSDPSESTEATESTQPEPPTEEPVPEETLPEIASHEENAPEENVPEDTLPEETVPPESVPDESIPEESIPEESVPEESEPDDSVPEESEPEEDLPILDFSGFYAVLNGEDVERVVSDFVSSTAATAASSAMAGSMSINTIRATINARLNSFSAAVSGYIGNAFYVDANAIANAFQFNMTEEDLQRLMETLYGGTSTSSAATNLTSLGYADLKDPASISIYLKDFDGKEAFIGFLDDYNAKMEAEGREEQVISYTDITGILMSSVSTIIDSVSYVLIAFVSVSLVVSSIMIGIITYISVMERTKEIGVLRAIGASKRNISQVFNAETFIIGLCSGLIGVGLTLLLNIPINIIIHELTGSGDINAQLPPVSAVILVALSVILTLIGGLIPSKKAAKKDPVIALRSE